MTDPRLRPGADGVVRLDECDSTNSVALTLLDDRSVRAVVAGVQSAGRGRSGRQWVSPAGSGLYLTWLARPTFEPTLAGALPLLAGVATAELCVAHGAEVQLKWPNDVWARKGKLAGVLCEARSNGDAWAAAVGVGLNLRTPPGGYPAEVPGIALDALGIEPPSVAAAADDLIDRLERWLRRVEAARELAPVVEAWRQLAPPRSQRLRWGGVDGNFGGLAADGSLWLETATGRRIVRSGDVELVHW